MKKWTGLDRTGQKQSLSQKLDVFIKVITCPLKYNNNKYFLSGPYHEAFWDARRWLK